MDKAIRALRQRFTTPSADNIQQNPICRICWMDYEGEDRPVMLPCGHVFGEECIVTWLKRVTPRGRHNGCPCCQAEFLPPSLHSRASAVRDVLVDLRGFLSMVIGGPRNTAFLTAWAVAHICTQLFLESKGAEYVGLGLEGLLVLWATRRCATLNGWKQAMRMFVVHLGLLAAARAYIGLWLS